MDVAFVRDGAFKIAAIVSKLSANFRVKVETLDAFLTRDGSDAAVHIFCSSLISSEQFRGVRQALEICDGEKVFIFPTHNAKSVARLQDLGFRDYFAAPIDADELRAVVRGAVNRRAEQRWGSLDPATRTALESSLASFDSCFARARRGEPLPMEELQLSAKSIRESAQLGGFDAWIDALANHHNYSFRHSMFVCGALTSFAHAIGIAGADIERLAVGGLLHDIGKSSVPLAILDKPGKLDGAEWQTMRKHPTYSREILLRENGLDPDMVAAAVDHHEKLDGTGYPDGLAGAQIGDCTRLTAIADVYSALIDRRSYKGGMSNEQALDLMATFKGHLDPDLFNAFRSFALEHA